jgi:TRAP-type C4-dicarboxylate transport system substrate-binding protein
MKNSAKWFLGLAAFMLVAGLTLGPLAYGASEAKPIELRLAHMFPVGSPSAKHIELWAEKIAADSNGRLKIRIFPANSLLPPPEIYSGVVKGVADIGVAWRYMPTGYEVGVLFPFFIQAPDTVTAGKVYDDVWKRFPDLMAKEWKDVKVLWLAPTEPTYLMSTKAIRGLEDIRGLQLRVPSPALADVVKALGAAPAFMSSADFVVALDKGTVNGGLPLFGLIQDYKLAGKIKTVLMQSLGNSTPLMFIMNKGAFSKLPPDLQSVINKSCEWGKQDTIRYWIEAYAETEKYCKDNGVQLVTLSGEDLKKWNEVVQGVGVKMAKDLDAKGYPGTELLRFINERIKHYASGG